MVVVAENHHVRRSWRNNSQEWTCQSPPSLLPTADERSRWAMGDHYSENLCRNTQASLEVSKLGPCVLLLNTFERRKANWSLFGIDGIKVRVWLSWLSRGSDRIRLTRRRSSGSSSVSPTSSLWHRSSPPWFIRPPDPVSYNVLNRLQSPRVLLSWWLIDFSRIWCSREAFIHIIYFAAFT